jgi:hypothetical protein
LAELHKEASGNPCARARKKCWVVYLKGRATRIGRYTSRGTVFGF